MNAHGQNCLLYLERTVNCIYNCIRYVFDYNQDIELVVSAWVGDVHVSFQSGHRCVLYRS